MTKLHCLLLLSSYTIVLSSPVIVIVAMQLTFMALKEPNHYHYRHCQL